MSNQKIGSKRASRRRFIATAGAASLALAARRHRARAGRSRR